MRNDTPERSGKIKGGIIKTEKKVHICTITNPKKKQMQNIFIDIQDVFSHFQQGK